MSSTVLTRPRAESPKYSAARNFVAGRFTDSAARQLDVLNPADGTVLSRVPLSSKTDLDSAVHAAREAFAGWSTTPIKDRVQVFYRYRTLLERDLGKLAALITEEHGKIPSEAEAEVQKAIELTEFACSLPQMATGEVLEVSRGIECRVDRHPVGIVASIVPFNFPSMVPHWTIPNAIVLGNCMILKPSELVPLSAGRIAELLAEAGLPPGGAKNHLFVLPDADPALTATNVVASMAGCTGQRCMAGSVMLAVSETDHLIRQLVENARSLVPGRD